MRPLALLVGAWVACAPGLVFADAEDFVQACLSSSNLAQPICECCAKKAQAELSTDGFQFLVASLQDNEQKTTQLRSKLPFTEALKAGMFMVNAPARCAAEQAPQ